MEKNCYVDYSKFFQVAESEFSEFVKNIRYEEVEQAADLIQKAKEAGNRLHISGIGKPAHIAGYIASLMSSTGTPAYFLHGTEAVHGSCGQLKENDVVIFISNSGETAEMRATVQAIKNNGCKVIGVSGNPASWLAKQSRCSFVCRCERRRRRFESGAENVDHHGDDGASGIERGASVSGACYPSTVCAMASRRKIRRA